MWLRKRFMEILNLDTDVKIYLMILTLSWVLIIVYMVYESKETEIKNNLKSYPYNHSQITDSTLSNGK
jgi:hypothetical protein